MQKTSTQLVNYLVLSSFIFTFQSEAFGRGKPTSIFDSPTTKAFKFKDSVLSVSKGSRNYFDIYYVQKNFEFKSYSSEGFRFEFLRFACFLFF